MSASREANTSDHWIKAISTHGNIRGVAIRATHLVQQIADMHGLVGEGARGLGEALMGGLFLASYCKPGERMNLNIQGNGLYRQALVDAHPDGTVRGYVIERSQGKSVRKPADDNEFGPWGSGTLSVLRAKGGEGKQPYIGTVPLITGHLAKDLTFYWLQSEQVPSAVGLAVNVEGNRVRSAGGFLIQVLPGASVEEVKAIEHHINDIQSLAEHVAQDTDPVHLLSRIFQSTAFMLLEEKPLRFECTCSWERVQRALALVGAAELKSMLAEDHQASVRCDFCGHEYKVTGEELQKLIDSTAPSQG